MQTSRWRAHAVSLALGLALGLTASQWWPRAARPWLPRPFLDVADIDGRRLVEADFEDHVVVLVFVAAGGGEQWLAELQRFSAELGDPRLLVIGISQATDRASTRALRDRLHLALPMIHDDDRELAHRFGTPVCFPTTYVYDRRGMPRHVMLLHDDDGAFEAELRALLAAPPARPDRGDG